MECEYKSGDEFMLFQRLPYNFHSGDLPIEILPTVHFDLTPQGILHAVPNLAAFVLPGYGLTGRGVVNCCLHRANHEISMNQTGATKSLFFTCVNALRLHKPLPIMIGGTFRFASIKDPIEDRALFNLTSAWQPRARVRYDANDVSVASDIAKRILRIDEESHKGGPNIDAALLYFSQVTSGLVMSLQLAYPGLWSALEALFVPRGNRAATLATRISTYLSEISLSVDLEEWVSSEYARRRSRFAHGHHRVSPWKPTAEPAPQAFARLHEITRLCILGFLGMDESQWNRLRMARKGDLQRALDGLDKPAGRFLADQAAWLD